MLTSFLNSFIPGLLLASSALPAVSGIDSVSGRIVGGENAVEGRYPYMVSIFTFANATANFGEGCGGSLIAPDVVLTAAHCFDSVAQVLALTEVTTPAYDLSQVTADSVYAVVQAVIHPNYNTTTLENDVALLKLSGTSTNHQLMTINQDAAFPTAGQITTDIGWGVTTEGGSSPDILQVLQSGRYITLDECRDVNNDPNNEFGTGITDDYVCTLTPANEGSCQGDSGGPLVVAGTNAAEDIQIGIVSNGVSCIAANSTNHYASTAYHYDFIRTTLCSMTTNAPTSFSCDATSAPVTSAPVTAAPITGAPVTGAPVTAAPVTAAPVTPAPVTSAPITPAPVTAAPVTGAPVTSAPVTATPGTTAPVMAPLPPSPGFPPCNVCNANDPTVRITNRDAIVEISGQDPTTCFNFQRAGDFGFIAEAFCPAVAGFLSPCDCMSQATAAPVTAAPVTAAPVTAAPVTPAPVTAAPITPAPVTSAPVTAAPATSAPVTPAPVTSAPGTAAPVTSAPVTAAPVTAAPVTGAPVTPAPVTSAPVTAAPVTTAPVTAAPVTSAPITTAPVVPATAAPVTAAPAAGEITSAPATAAPVSVAPVVSTPTAVPITVPRPPTAAPVTAAPVADKKGKKGKKEKKMKMKKDNKGKEG